MNCFAFLPLVWVLHVLINKIEQVVKVYQHYPDSEYPGFLCLIFLSQLLWYEFKILLKAQHYFYFDFVNKSPNAITLLLFNFLSERLRLCIFFSQYVLIRCVIELLRVVLDYILLRYWWLNYLVKFVRWTEFNTITFILKVLVVFKCE